MARVERKQTRKGEHNIDQSMQILIFFNFQISQKTDDQTCHNVEMNKC